MPDQRFVTAALTLALAAFTVSAAPADDWPPVIERRIPPKGIAISDVDKVKVKQALKSLVPVLRDAQMDFNNGHFPERRPGEMPDLFNDILVYVGAVHLALHHNEFYGNSDVEKAMRLIAAAAERARQLSLRREAWPKQHGRVVRGYRSSIDGSFQPYGLEIPEELDLTKPVPLYVWLHGRGDKVTNLHFIHQRETKGCPISPYVTDGIILHPFGRHCMGFKHAGEIDVLEAIESVKKRYKIDEDRVVLMGFSMGGAGVWHIAAHYPSYWVAASPGAGFAETARYIGLKKENYPPWYEQKLWGVYDVPAYTRSLFNLPVIVYSGEKDKQIQAARVMEEAYAAMQRKLPHVIGPGMGHKYHPDSLKEIMAVMRSAVRKGLDRWPDVVTLQTRTLRYNKAHWLEVAGLGEHWRDAQVEARVAAGDGFIVTTKNVTGLTLRTPRGPKQPMKKGTRIVVDGDTVTLPDDRLEVHLAKSAKWLLLEQTSPYSRLRKQHGLQGPIDDAFMSRFVVVTPTGKSRHPAVQRWVDFELARFKDRWLALFRGAFPTVTDTEVLDAPDRYKDANLILWGDRQSNRVIAKIADELPFTWTEKSVKVGAQAYDAASHVPLLIYPNPLNSERYVVLNSGPTFREGHDRTNSLQNPKLGDWAVIDLSQPPNNLAPGRVAAAGFFDEYWRLKRAPSKP